MLKRRYARARPRHEPGSMNQTETAYRDHLELMKRSGEIIDYKFEAMKLRLAKKTFYTPDFLVTAADNTLELHEVKGIWEDDARVKIKVAAETFPIFRFIAIQKKAKKLGGGWKVEEF